MSEKMKDITPRNSDGKAHGYWKTFNNSILNYEGNYCNGKQDGYWKFYDSNCIMLYFEGNYINGKRIGLWKFYDENSCLFEEKYYV
jgi:antitoxin component YwqK of YwqJK toxin-antitoxin module